eukprot:GCRY01001402.1.p1 GENE.GCRY01001402.1~~GCRY01001402.1.p1  ORF type:complete len:348 (+),score=44.51 GCRY01001402.1:185-1228(+)
MKALVWCIILTFGVSVPCLAISLEINDLEELTAFFEERDAGGVMDVTFSLPKDTILSPSKSIPLVFYGTFIFLGDNTTFSCSESYPDLFSSVITEPSYEFHNIHFQNCNFLSFSANQLVFDNCDFNSGSMLLKTSVLHFNNSRFSKIPSSIVFQSGVFGTGLFLENCEFFDFPGSTPLFELNPLNGSSFHLNIVDSTFHDIESKGDSLIGLRNRDLLASSVYIDNCTFVKVQFFRSGILYFNPELASKMMDFSLVFKNCLFDDVSATMSSSLHSILLSVNFQFRGRLSILFDSCTIQNIRGTTEGTTVMVWAIASSVVVRNTTITNAEVDTLFLLNEEDDSLSDEDN